MFSKHHRLRPDQLDLFQLPSPVRQPISIEIETELWFRKLSFVNKYGRFRDRKKMQNF